MADARSLYGYGCLAWSKCHFKEPIGMPYLTYTPPATALASSSITY